MATVATVLKQAVHNKFESQIKTAEADLDLLRARTKVAKANVELKAIAELFPKKQIIRTKLDELRSASEDRREEVKAELQSRISEFEKSIEAIEPRAFAKTN